METLKFNVNRQIRMLMIGFSIAMMINFFVTLIIQLPYLPVFYICSTVFYAILAKISRLERFLLVYILNLLQTVCQSILSVYVLGDDCGIQMYLFSLAISCNYVRMTKCSPSFCKVFIILSYAFMVFFYILSDEIIDFWLDPLTKIANESEIFFTILNVSCSLTLLALISGTFFYGDQKEYNRLAHRNTLLKLAADKDALTGLHNRRGIDAFVQDQYRQWQRGRSQFTVALADIDNFKTFNDSYGHDAGDTVLKTLSQVLSRSLPDTACIARWGGEEFLFLFSCGVQEAAGELEDIRRLVEDTCIPYEEKLLYVTMTFGVAQAQQGQTIDDVVKAADERLYIGKQRGRNCVVYE